VEVVAVGTEEVEAEEDDLDQGLRPGEADVHTLGLAAEAEADPTLHRASIAAHPLPTNADAAAPDPTTEEDPGVTPVNILPDEL